MRIGSPKEVMPGEARVAMTPDSAAQLQKLGYECFVESGAGQLARFSDAEYQAAGVTVVDSADALFDSVDVVAKVRPPIEEEVKRLKKGQTLVGFFNPAHTCFNRCAENRSVGSSTDAFRAASRAGWLWACGWALVGFITRTATPRLHARVYVVVCRTQACVASSFRWS